MSTLIKVKCSHYRTNVPFPSIKQCSDPLKLLKVMVHIYINGVFKVRPCYVLRVLWSHVGCKGHLRKIGETHKKKRMTHHV